MAGLAGLVGPVGPVWFDDCAGLTAPACEPALTGRFTAALPDDVVTDAPVVVPCAGATTGLLSKGADDMVEDDDDDANDAPAGADGLASVDCADCAATT